MSALTGYLLLPGLLPKASGDGQQIVVQHANIAAGDKV